MLPLSQKTVAVWAAALTAHAIIVAPPRSCAGPFARASTDVAKTAVPLPHAFPFEIDTASSGAGAASTVGAGASTSPAHAGSAISTAGVNATEVHGGWSEGVPAPESLDCRPSPVGLARHPLRPCRAGRVALLGVWHPCRSTVLRRTNALRTKNGGRCTPTSTPPANPSPTFDDPAASTRSRTRPRPRLFSVSLTPHPTSCTRSPAGVRANERPHRDLVRDVMGPVDVPCTWSSCDERRGVGFPWRSR